MSALAGVCNLLVYMAFDEKRFGPVIGHITVYKTYRTREADPACRIGVRGWLDYYIYTHFVSEVYLVIDQREH